jgi:hypothetical protein
MSSFVSRFLTPERPSVISLEALQERILQRLLVAALVICVALGVRDTLVGLSYDLLPAVLLAGLAGLALYRWLPRSRPWLGTLVAGAVLAAVADEMRGTGLAVTPASAFLLVVVPLVTLIGNALGGWLLALASAALALAVEWAHPPVADLPRQALNDFLVLLFAGQTVAWIFQRSFGRLQQGLQGQQAALESVEANNQAISRPLFVMLGQSLTRLEGLLAAPGPLNAAELSPWSMRSRRRCIRLGPWRWPRWRRACPAPATMPSWPRAGSSPSSALGAWRWWSPCRRCPWRSAALGASATRWTWRWAC